ncbi:hypothetical protein BLL52_4306 [Rhodoferax antarcticus ANT.BR]|uniref:Uncharacterized protein n=1 Tax=Rhodoferax antarcticus ANT.BR TaxID=1111071 RepID=A0A1Q8Y9I1_9BURK|nr:hypothetical protein BLL52_4306 [Rhodoferax antarcticus ANT.BR]
MPPAPAVQIVRSVLRQRAAELYILRVEIYPQGEPFRVKT